MRNVGFTGTDYINKYLKRMPVGAIMIKYNVSYSVSRLKSDKRMISPQILLKLINNFTVKYVNDY